jgi:hypothetical protein
MANKVFISPGVFTSERDLTFVTRNIGITTLGMAGETTKGPAFQPIFITNYDEFLSFFGGTNPTLIPNNGAPKYELPYIAKDYLSESNQLFVTRVLGFSGYDARQSWAITIDAALDPTTVQTISAITYNTFIEYEVSSAGTFDSVVINDPIVDELYTRGLITLNGLLTAPPTTTFTQPTTYYKVSQSSNIFEGASFTQEVVSTGATVSGGFSGITSGITTQFSGTSYSDVENMVVALLRSRAKYDANEILNFEVTGSNVNFDVTVDAAATNPLSNFSLTGTSTTQGAFNYILSFDRTKQSYITKVLGSKAQDKKTALYVEELYQNMLNNLITENKVYGVKLSLIEYSNAYNDYKEEYQTAISPWIVSEVRGNKVLRLFRVHTISAGDTANNDIKFSIANIKPDEKEFDLLVRNFNDTDANPVIIERFTRCTMNPTSNNFIGRKIGTVDGKYQSKSRTILIEFDETSDTSDAFPAGFVGFPIRDYTDNSNPTVQAPIISYKDTYGVFENKRKFYLGLSDTKGIDQNIFNYKGKPNSTTITMFTATTKGFHMDVDATNVTIDNVQVIVNPTGGTYTPTYEFEVGCCEFKTDAGLIGTDYEKIFARKFTFAPYGGFDGWDVFRTRRTNTDPYIINGQKGQLGLQSGTFVNRALSNGDTGINSDYYAYWEAIRTFANPEATAINVFTTPGIDTFDNTNLVEETIEMIETERADSIYIATTPDTDSAGDVLDVEDVVNNLDGMYDSNYTATYFPWIQINDTENNVFIYVPPTRDVVRNIAITDKVSFPWFAVAGIDRGTVNAVQVRKKLTQAERDVLYENRVNPITFFTTDGIKIWGNKNMQVRESALDRLNVRRLLLQARRLVAAVGIRLLFEQNDDVVRNRFLGLVNPILDNIRAERGLEDFRVVLSNDPEERDRNELIGKIFIKPVKALEFIEVEFNILTSGASFDDV